MLSTRCFILNGIVGMLEGGCNQNTFESNKLSLKTLEIKLKDNFSFQKFSRTLNRFSEKCAQNPKRWLDYSPTP